MLNYTPLDMNKFEEKEKNSLNFFLLVVTIITVIVFSILLYVFIQRYQQKTDSTQKQEEEQLLPIEKESTSLSKPAEIFSATQSASVSPSPILKEEEKQNGTNSSEIKTP